MPLFSVIIPTYNRERYVAATIRSVVDQSFSDHEVIVVDDGSTDRTVEIARSFGPRVTVLEQPNQGPGAARNLGARHARGEYLAFLDSDDLWFPWGLETYRDVLDANARPRVVIGSPWFFDDEAEIAGVRRDPLEVAVFPDYLSADPHEVLPGGGLLVVAAEAFAAAGGFSPQRVYCEDADLYLRLGVQPGCAAIRQPFTIAYRRHAGSAMHDSPKVAAGLDLMLRHEHDGAYPGGAARRADRWKFLAHTCRNVSFNSAQVGQVRRALRFYGASLRPNIAARRWKFVLGLPLVAAAAAVGLRRQAADLHGAAVRSQPALR